MNTQLIKATALCLASGLVFSTPALSENTANTEKMWEAVQSQQQQIEALKKELKEAKQEREAITEVVEAEQGQGTGTDNSPGWWQNTALGGYGELHYNGGEKDEIDFHRFVLFVNHQFSDSIRLYSELELEHALSGEGKDGEVELEQAFIEFDLNSQHRAKAGLFLVPTGLLNETHEPPTFFGVERNPVENQIIPTTWWEAGVGLSGELPLHLAYDLAFHSGLKTPTDGDNAFKIRSGRQKVSEASAKDGAVTARLSWKGIPGVKVSGSAQYQNDITQSELDESIDAVLLSSNLDVRKGGFGLRALYAHWNLGGQAPKASGRDVQEGWYVEPAYYLGTPVGEVGFFARFNQFDNESGDSIDSEYEQIDVGVNYWPHQNVVLKADVAFVDAPGEEKDDDILNLGVGFSF